MGQLRRTGQADLRRQCDAEGTWTVWLSEWCQKGGGVAVVRRHRCCAAAVLSLRGVWTKVPQQAACPLERGWHWSAHG
jgi:hypothetical protein